MNTTCALYDRHSCILSSRLCYFSVFTGYSALIMCIGCNDQAPMSKKGQQEIVHLSNIFNTNAPIIYSYSPPQSSELCSAVYAVQASDSAVRHVILEPEQERYCSLIYLFDESEVVLVNSGFDKKYPVDFLCTTSVGQPKEQYAILEQKHPSGILKIGMWPRGLLIIQYPDGRVIHAYSNTDFWRILTMVRPTESSATSSTSLPTR